MTELALTQAQLMDPLLNLAAGGDAFATSEHASRSFGPLGKAGARLLLAVGLPFAAFAAESFNSEEVAYADYRCSRFDPGAYRVDGQDEFGLPTTYYMCPGDGPTTPTTTTGGGTGGGGTGGGGTGGGGTGGGGTGGGSGGGGTPTGPSAPSWPDILAFSGCGEGLGDVPFSQQIDVIGGKPDIQRLEEMIAKCALTFDAGATDSTQNNWNGLIELQEAKITAPDANQQPVMSAYMQKAWDALHSPVEVTTTTTIPTEATTTTIPVEVTTTTTIPTEATTTIPAEATVPTTVFVAPPADAGSGGPKQPDTNYVWIFGIAVAGAAATYGALRLRAKVIRDRLKTGYGTKPKHGPGTTGLAGGIGSAGASAGN